MKLPRNCSGMELTNKLSLDALGYGYRLTEYTSLLY
jgi:hypothetical protein